MEEDDLGKAAEWARKVAQKFEKNGRLLFIAGIFWPSGHGAYLAVLLLPSWVIDVVDSRDNFRRAAMEVEG